MKDEEMADKYASDLLKGLNCNLGNPRTRHINSIDIEEAYLAGLKAGRLQWHKVAAGDLPTTVGRRFLVSNRYCTMIGYWNGKTFVGVDEDTAEIANPIAWCEIPKFEVEK